jgi:hypothetical protein
MIYCKCTKWVENIDKLTAPYCLNLSAVGQYTGETFSFCPWCGKRLEKQENE